MIAYSTGGTAYTGTTIGNRDYDRMTTTADTFCYGLASRSFQDLSEILFQLELSPSHKDPYYLVKRDRFERWMNYLHLLMIRRMFNVNFAVMFRRCGLSKSGWLARVGKRKKGK